jgi:hypothetical protein
VLDGQYTGIKGKVRFMLVGKVRTLLTELLTLFQKENFIGTVVIVHTMYCDISIP